MNSVKSLMYCINIYKRNHTMHLRWIFFCSLSRRVKWTYCIEQNRFKRSSLNGTDFLHLSLDLFSLKQLLFHTGSKQCGGSAEAVRKLNRSLCTANTNENRPFCHLFRCFPSTLVGHVLWFMIGSILCCDATRFPSVPHTYACNMLYIGSLHDKSYLNVKIYL